MSRSDTKTQSNENRIKSPLQFYIDYKPGVGLFSYWDGEKNVTTETLELTLLDARSSVSGWSDLKSGRIWSNMVKSTTKQDLIVKCGTETLVSGKYSDIKGEVKDCGGKFTVNLFAFANIDGNVTPVCLRLHSTALQAWTKFVEDEKMHNIYEKKIVVSRGEQKKHGKVVYTNLKFILIDITEEESAAAKDFDLNHLKPYLEQWVKKEEPTND